MCGVFFYYSADDVSDAAINYSFDILKNRGPDAKGFLKQKDKSNNSVVLGHTRLSILDLNERSNQPFISGNWAITFNGEIYNHLYLRKKFLPDFNFSTTSDTETLLELYRHYPVSQFINDIEGMFAYIVYNNLNNTIYVQRDLAGEKPLYLCFQENFFMIASDMRCAKPLLKSKPEISLYSTAMYTRYGYIPNPHTIFESCFKLPPSTFFELNLSNFKFKTLKNLDSFFDMPAVTHKTLFTFESSSLEGNHSHLTTSSMLDGLIKTAVSKQLQADVPVGTFLSGGIDSSLISAYASSMKPDIKAFNIGFEFDDFDESIHARKVADYLGIDFCSHTCTKDDAIAQIHNLPHAYDEPFGDFSQIPTLLISKIASQEVKVILTGDCGDEIFGGYTRYLLAKKYLPALLLVPDQIKTLLPKLLNNKFSNVFFHSVFNKLFSLSSREKLDRSISRISEIHDEFSFFNSMISQPNSSRYLSFGNSDLNPEVERIFNLNTKLDPTEKMMRADFMTYMTDDILCKVDRASMYYGLETRAPFLDPSVVSFGYSLDIDYKIDKRGKTKSILRDLLGKKIPSSLFERPKQGFGVPIGNWIRTDMKDWANDLLDQNVIRKHGLFDFPAVNKLFNDHINGNNHDQQLWYLLQFNSWYLNNYEEQ